jgi:hypothetical protein
MVLLTINQPIQMFFFLGWIFLMIFGFFDGIFLMAKVSLNLANGIALFLATILSSSLAIIFHLVDVVHFTSCECDANVASTSDNEQPETNDQNISPVLTN